MHSSRAVWISIVATLVAACDGNAASDEAARLGKAATDKATDAGKALADDLSAEARAGSKRALAAGAEQAKTWAGARPTTGELTDDATSWLQAHATKDNAVALVAKGQQIAPVALDIGKTLDDAVDSDTVIEPIYQRVGPKVGQEAGSAASASNASELDRKIGGMPRVEVVDGVQIGFHQLDEVTAAEAVKERAYLVLWRQDEHLVGFVYRSKRTIDIETLVAEAPRLVRLTREALPDPSTP